MVDSDDGSDNLVSSPAGLNQPDLTTTPLEIVPTDTDLLQTYTFYLKVDATDNISINQYFGPYKLIVGCSSDNTVTVLTYPSLTTEMMIDLNAVPGSNETYSFPAWSVSPADCGITGYQITFDDGATFPTTTTNGITYPAAGCTSSPCLDIDVNIDTAQVVSFKIQGTANGGATQLSD